MTVIKQADFGFWICYPGKTKEYKYCCRFDATYQTNKNFILN